MINPSISPILSDSGFTAIDRLFRTPAFVRQSDPSELHQARQDLFLEAMNESYAWHKANSTAYQGIVTQNPKAPQVVQSLADVECLPWMFVQSFKERDLLSIPQEEVSLILTSSGTSGSQTKSFLDNTSLNRISVAGYEVYRALSIVSPESKPCNYMLFTYDIHEMPHLGTAWTDVQIAQMVSALSMHFLIRRAQPQAALNFDLEYALECYAACVESGQPLRLLGFPAFMYRTFFEAEQRGLPRLSYEAARDSWVLTGGGWKNHHDQTIEKHEFTQFMQRTIGIPPTQVRDLFGMAEHGVGYVDCEHGRLHVPLYAHAITRDVHTLAIQPYGQKGLLQLFSPLLKSSPGLSLLTTDEVIIHDTPCPCGRSGMGLEYVGRVGLTQYEGCALRALDYLKV